MKTLATSAAKALGIHDGQVAAYRLKDGKCPVGIVIDMQVDYFTIRLYDWFVGMFGGDERDIGYGLVDSIITTTYERDGEQRVYKMDPLGDTQTEWIEGHTVSTETA